MRVFLFVGLKPTAEAFFLFMFTVILAAYTATSMALAISADQTVVAIANIFMTIAFVFMMVKKHTSPHNSTNATDTVYFVYIDDIWPAFIHWWIRINLAGNKIGGNVGSGNLCLLMHGCV